MTPAELQEVVEAAKRMIAAYEGSCLDYIAKDELTVARAILSLFSRVEGMREECAKVADGYLKGPNYEVATVARWIAEDIRSLPFAGEG
jgi:hypothetical protein